MGALINTILLLTIIFGRDNDNYATGSVVIADNSMSKMVELTTRKPYCLVSTDRGEIRSALLTSDPRRIRQMTDESIDKLVTVCRSNQVNSPHQGGFIYPGTKWCGPGNISRNFTDLGYHRKEDMCCRDHDNCPNTLVKDECKQGICNDSPFTRSHCDCDANFRRCLQNVNTETANTIGAIFFNVVQIICFQERNPCSRWQNDTTATTVPSPTDDLTPRIDVRFDSEDNGANNSCAAHFVQSGRYVGPRFPRFTWRSKPEFFLNIILRKLRLL